MRPSLTHVEMLKCWWTQSCGGYHSCTENNGHAFLEDFLKRLPYPLALKFFPFPPEVLWAWRVWCAHPRIRRLTLQLLTTLLLSMPGCLVLILMWKDSKTLHENARVSSPVDLLVSNYQYFGSFFLREWEQLTMPHCFKAWEGKITWVSNKRNGSD